MDLIQICCDVRSSVSLYLSYWDKYVEVLYCLPAFHFELNVFQINFFPLNNRSLIESFHGHPACCLYPIVLFLFQISYTYFSSFLMPPISICTPPFYVAELYTSVGVGIIIIWRFHTFWNNHTKKIILLPAS